MKLKIKRKLPVGRAYELIIDYIDCEGDLDCISRECRTVKEVSDIVQGLPHSVVGYGYGTIPNADVYRDITILWHTETGTYELEAEST